MDLNLRDKVVIVTGASRGIGKAIALGFAEEAAKLSICGRTAETLNVTAKEIEARGSEVFFKPTDVTNKSDAEAFVNETLGKFGRIDVLINNVGGSRWTPTLKISDEEWHSILDLNLVSAARLSRAVIPTMLEQGSGVIIMISSIWGRESGGHISYNVAKAGEISLSKSLALELAGKNIRVNTVAPGAILFSGGGWDQRFKSDPEGRAEFIKNNLPIGRFGTTREISDVVVFLASERASLVTGSCLNVDGCQSSSNI